jgi:hypothetical protein
MKNIQKSKYFIYGAISAAVLAPLMAFAVKTIPITFGEGDVISAGVMNSLLGRINDVQQGFTSVADLDGNWSCTVYDTSAFGTDKCSADGAILKSKTGNLTFNAASKTWSWSGQGSLNDCGSGGSSAGIYDVKAGILVTDLGVYDTRRRGPNEFVWFITNSMPPSGFNVCVKASLPPAPADALTPTVSGSTVALGWTDNSTDETGFKVQYKTSAKGTWTTATTTAANATSYTVSGLTTGTYWFRVVATNANGDAMSSSEVQGVIP